MVQSAAAHRRIVWLCCLAAMLTHFVIAADRPLFSLYLTQSGAPVKTVALLTSLYGAAALLVAYPAGAWTDRLGVRPIVLAGVIMLGVGTVVIPFAGVQVSLLGLSQTLISIGGTIAIVAIQAGVAAISGAADRDRNFTGLMFWGSVGQMLGPLLGGAASDLVGWRVTFLALTAPLVLCLLLPLGSAGSRQPTGQSGGALAVLRERRVQTALLSGILVISTIDTITAFFPIYGEEIGLSATAIGLILGARAGASMAVRPLQLAVVKRLTRSGAVIWVLATSAVVTCLLGLTSNFVLLLLLAIAAGACLGLGQPLTMTEVVDATPEPLQGRALGVRLAGNRLAQFLGPLLYGAVASLGVTVVFVGSGLLLGVGAVAARTTRRA